MNDSKIKVLLVEPEKYPKEIVIDDSLEAMQEVVGGDIEEYMPYDDDVAIICNEEGKMRGLPLNRAVYVQDNDKKEMVDIICGKFFICYAPPESESFQSLPDDMMKKYKEQFKYPERRENESKNDTPLVDWLKVAENRENAKYLPSGISYELSNFEEFMEKRQELMSKALKEILL